MSEMSNEERKARIAFLRYQLQAMKERRADYGDTPQGVTADSLIADIEEVIEEMEESPDIGMDGEPL